MLVGYLMFIIFALEQRRNEPAVEGLFFCDQNQLEKVVALKERHQLRR